MKIKSYKKFNEDSNSTASSTAGSGDISNPQPGSLPGKTGTEGTDLTYYLKPNRGRKKGSPSEVTDLRDLEISKDITKIKENLDFSNRMPELNDKIKSVVDECLAELYDKDFRLNLLKYDNNRESEFRKVGIENGLSIQEELRISLNKMVNMVWIGNMSLSGKFTDSTEELKVSTLRGSGSELSRNEKELTDIVETASLRLKDFLGYQKGIFDISWLVVGSAMPYKTDRYVNINISIVLLNDIKIDNK